MAALLAGLPQEVAGVTVNRLCASGLSAVVSACHAIRAGDGELFVAGGVESMTRAPFVTAKAERPFPRGNQTAWDTTLGWRFPNPRLEAMFPLESMGETGENVAERFGVSREDQDAFALESQRRHAAAAEAGRFDDELVPVGDVDARRASAARHLARRSSPRCKPAFRPDGTRHGRELERPQRRRRRARDRERREGRARSASSRSGASSRARSPASTRGSWASGPIPAVRKLLARAGVESSDARPRRAERGVRLAEPAGDPRARARSRAGERERRRDRASATRSA